MIWLLWSVVGFFTFMVLSIISAENPDSVLNSSRWILWVAVVLCGPFVWVMAVALLIFKQVNNE